MENVYITMNENGNLTCSDPNGGFIEEMNARQLVISVNDFFRSSVISYFTISFEPYGLGKKIVTDNIYKTGNTGEATYSALTGTISCPIYDYVSVSPKVSLQIDGYETDSNSDISAIYKSGILDLHFSESLVGDKVIPDMSNAQQKLSEKISEMIDDEFDSLVITTEKISDDAVTSDKLSSEVRASLAKAESALQAQDISGKADIADVPTALSQLTGDSTHRTVTDAEKTSWNEKEDVSNKTQTIPLGGASTTAYPSEKAVLDLCVYFSDYLENYISYVESVMAYWDEVPTALSDLTDDLGSSPTHTHSQYLTSHQDISGKADIADIPTKTSDLTNDSGFLTSHQDISGKENVSNKVTTIDTATPSNTEYPSESAVVSYVSGLVGSINTVLDSINGEVI